MKKVRSTYQPSPLFHCIFFVFASQSELFAQFASQSTQHSNLKIRKSIQAFSLKKNELRFFEKIRMKKRKKRICKTESHHHFGQESPVSLC